MGDQRRPASAGEPMELETKASPAVEIEIPEFSPLDELSGTWEYDLMWGDDTKRWDEGNEEWDGGSAHEWMYDYWFDPSWLAQWWFDDLSWYDPSWSPESGVAACNGDDMSWYGTPDATWWWYEEPEGPTPAIEDPFGAHMHRNKKNVCFAWCYLFSI